MLCTGLTYSMLSDVLGTLKVEVMLDFIFARILIKSDCQLSLAFLLKEAIWGNKLTIRYDMFNCRIADVYGKITVKDW